MSLRKSYSLLAPFYDSVAGPLFRHARQRSLARLTGVAGQLVLLDGVGTGLDLPHLPSAHRYTGLDITRAMLARAVGRARALAIDWVQGDCLQLPFGDARFDCVVLHLILAVVPDGRQALREAARVTKPSGRLLIFDKFLRRSDRAVLRRWIGPLAGRLVTRTDVVFEDLLAGVSGLTVQSDEPALARGWFRYITLVRSS
jgi:phosphatidylethanolamine/phosphatidyl-N-methylethanolamine N-methyltransferase